MKNNSYEDESPLSYDRYAARQRLEDHNRRRMELGLGEYDDDGDDTATVRRIIEALAWCAVIAVIVVAIFFAATK